MKNNRKEESKEKNSIKLNYAFSLLFQLLTIIVPLITTPYLSRVLEPDGIGIYSFTNTNTSYFTILGVLGLGTYGQLQIAKAKEDIKLRSKLFYEIMFTRLGAHLICIFAFAVLVFLSEKYKTMYEIQGILLVASALDITWFFQGIEEFKNIAIRNIVIKLISVGLIFLFVKEKGDLYVYALLLSGSALVSSLCFYPILKKRICRVELKVLRFGNHIRGSLVFFIPTIASVVMTSLDKTMIGLITHSEQENGYYAQAYKIETLCFSVFSALNLVMRSRMTYLFYNNKREEMSRMLMKSMQFVSILAFPISFGIMAVSKSFVPWFFGAGYEKVTILLPVFAFWLIFKSHSNCLLEQHVMASGRQRTFNTIIWVGAICNIVLNASLIPFFQSIGAAVASVASEFVIFMLAFHVSSEVVTLKTLTKQNWKYIIAALIMAATVYFIGILIDRGPLTTILQIAVGCVCYAGLLILFKDLLIKESISGIKNKMIR